MKLMSIYNQLNEQTYRVYHGSNTKFRAFNLKKTAQGIAWFADRPEAIRSGDAGASGTKYIMAFDITIENPAGWDEYDQYSVGELKGLGFDGIILQDSGADGIDVLYYVVFDQKNIKYVGTEPNI